MTTALRTEYQDELIGTFEWLQNLSAYRQFYNVPRTSNYEADARDPSIYGRLELARLFASGRVLDVGCNGGRFAFPLAREGRSVLGIDISVAFIVENLERLFGEPDDVFERLTFHQDAAEDLSYHNEFETVLVMDLLEYVIDPVLVATRALDAATPDGLVIVTTAIAGGVSARRAEYADHVRELTPAGVEAILHQAGAEEVGVWSLPGQHVLAIGLKSSSAAARILERMPQNLMQRQLLVSAIEALGWTQAAYDRAWAILEEDPEDLPMRFRIALLLSRVGEYDAALEMAAPLVDHPKFATRSFYRWLGQALVAAGQIEDAANAFELAVRSPSASEDDWVGTLWEI